MEKINVSLKHINPDTKLPLPVYASRLAAGADLFADIQQDIVLKPMTRVLIPTGVAIAVPDGFEAGVRSRSGLALKNGVFTLNSPGTIDADYRGEVKIILFNAGDEDFIIQRGMRIAQLVLSPVVQANWQVVSDLDDTERGAGGFGSSGVK